MSAGLKTAEWIFTTHVWRIGHGPEQTGTWIKRGIQDLILTFFNNVRELLISLEILNVSLPYLGGWYEGMHSTERRSSVFKLMEI